MFHVSSPGRPRQSLVFPAPLLPLVFLASTTSLLADNQRDLTSISLEELAQTRVTSVSKEEEPLFQTPAAVYVITAEDIRRSGATSIPEALRLAPGVEVARINSNQWAVGIRGFTSRLSRSELALMDGRSLYTPLFAGTYWEVQDTVLDDIERIEVVRGPGGTLWGANAVNGIVNIITKNSRDTQGGLVYGGGGNQERGFVGARYGGTVGDTGSYRVYGKYFDREPGYHASGDDFDGWHMAQSGFRSDWKLPSSDRLTVQGDIYNGRAGERTALTSFSPPYQRTVDTPAELSGGNLLARWDHSLLGSSLAVTSYYDRTRRLEPTFHETRDTFNIDIQDQFGLARQKVVWGLGYRFSSGRGQGADTIAFVPPDRTDHIFSLFVQDEIALVKDRLTLSLGTKLERNEYTGFELQPSGRLLWSPGSRQAIWAAITRAVRTPSRIERDLSLTASFSPTLPVFAQISGNDSFTSESVVAYEAGYRVRPTDRLSLDLALFYNRYSDLLSIESGTPIPAPGRQILPFRFANMLGGHASGLELSSLAQLTRSWTMAAEYSYLSMSLMAQPGSTDLTSVPTDEASPRHIARIRSSWRLPAGLDADVSLRWVDAIRSQKTPAYSALDARLAWPVVAKLELAVVGQNLLRDHHLEFGSGPTAVEIPRSIYGEARWRW
ncbi:MAG TPA: TonB-dependent receptor [Vicinamibacteria bacterium]|jgi:iron complex outermembrane receptor protein|nr:TonB-dependent receptor [Vicinamibacteria bacterium]